MGRSLNATLPCRAFRQRWLGARRGDHRGCARTQRADRRGQRLGTNRALRTLHSTGQVLLRRDGIQHTASAAELVPGDVIELHAGDTVPADCRLWEATALEVDEASLTGESALVTKTVAATAAASLGDRHSMLYEGSVVAAGQATGLVVAIGERTEAGRTARLTGQAPPPSGVQTRLRTLTRQTLPVSIGAGLGLLGRSAGPPDQLSVGAGGESGGGLGFPSRL